LRGRKFYDKNVPRVRAMKSEQDESASKPFKRGARLMIIETEENTQVRELFIGKILQGCGM